MRNKANLRRAEERLSAFYKMGYEQIERIIPLRKQSQLPRSCRPRLEERIVQNKANFRSGPLVYTGALSDRECETKPIAMNNGGLEEEESWGERAKQSQLASAGFERKRL